MRRVSSVQFPVVRGFLSTVNRPLSTVVDRVSGSVLVWSRRAPTCVRGSREWLLLLFRLAGSCPSDPVKPHGPLVRLGFTCRHASTCRLSTWWSPTALQRPCGLGGFILGRASHLDAFSGSPVPAWLPGAAFGNTTGTPEASPSRSSRTRDGFPQSSNAHDGYRPNCLTTF